MSITVDKPETIQELFDYCDEAIACVRYLIDKSEIEKSTATLALIDHFLDARIIVSELRVKND